MVSPEALSAFKDPCQTQSANRRSAAYVSGNSALKVKSATARITVVGTLTTAMAIRCSAERVPPRNLFNGMPTNIAAMMIAGIDSTTWVMLTRSRR